MRKRGSKVVFYRDKRNEWRWRIVTANGRTVADGGEGYKRRAGAARGLAAAIRAALNDQSVAL